MDNTNEIIEETTQNVPVNKNGAVAIAIGVGLAIAAIVVGAKKHFDKKKKNVVEEFPVDANGTVAEA